MNFPRRRSVHSQRGRRRRARWVVAIVSLCAATALAAPTRAQERDAPLVFSADDVVYDRDSAIVIAEGRVEVARAERVLLADRVSYNTETGVVSASGNVSILEPNGDVVFASQVELRDDLREGFITGIGVLMADGSRLAANAARRTADQRTVMTRAVYSACPLFCPLDGHGSERAPLWQFKAARVIHDQKAKRIVYRDAVLEFGGFPVAYTPYFSHPDPTVDRKTGFLAPTYGSSDPLGAKVELPFFIAFAPHRDATITPLITSKEGAVLGAEYRERDGRGAIRGARQHHPGGPPRREQRGAARNGHARPCRGPRPLRPRRYVALGLRPRARHRRYLPQALRHQPRGHADDQRLRRGLARPRLRIGQYLFLPGPCAPRTIPARRRSSCRWWTTSS